MVIVDSDDAVVVIVVDNDDDDDEDDDDDNDDDGVLCPSSLPNISCQYQARNTFICALLHIYIYI